MITRMLTYTYCLFLLIHVMKVTGSEMGFCSETTDMTFETECTSCHINVFIDCPKGSNKLTTHEGNPGCTYEMHLGPGPNVTKEGCTHMCEKQIMNDKCCKGFWGPKCDECPGGYRAACNGHGQCSDLMNGTGECTCETGWTGYACELCTNSSVGGENCTQVITDGLCTDVICPNNSNCVVIDGEAICMCNTSDNTSVVCKELDACMESPKCHDNATCTLSSIADMSGLGKNCTCNSGFHGDGYQCDPIDLCQDNNGGCDLDTSICNYMGPGQRECMCRDGYEKQVLETGCALIDLCALNKSACHPKAKCETVVPGEIRCSCNEGYEGDGHVCFGNILQTIKDLDESDPELEGQMTLIQGAIEKYYMTELTEHASFTMFVPTNEGFRTINTADYQKWLNDKVRVRQILRQHIVVGQLTTDKLVNETVFHTLQGTAAELMVAGRSDTLKFRLMGSSKKAKIVRSNIAASNGIIHIINKLLTNSPDNHGYEEKSIYENIKIDGKYNRFETLVETAGTEIKDILMNQNVTVFVPNNAAFDSLPIGALDYLTSAEGKGHLIGLLKNHIFENIIEITDLINKRRLTSLAKIASWVSVSLTGQVQFNMEINVTQADITAKNGFIHDVDAVLLSHGISVLPNNCDISTYKDVMGPCDDCREEGRCFPPDVELNTTVDCLYFSRNLDGQYVKLPGCAKMCNRTYRTPKCCEGFYGFDCLPCPGGHENACNGRGKCDEGYFGKGACTCDPYFGGDACDTCADDRHFGPNCTQECTCLQDMCDSGPGGNGKCRHYCYPPMMGENCDVQAAVCNDDLHHCHAHAMCIWIEKDLKFKCICKPGYSGNGLTCGEVDPCQEEYRGGCHLQATCEKTGPGTANCTCNEGWTGDGKHCHMETVCGAHSECHKYATCLPTTPGKRICVCKDDFIGNGTYCLYKDRCEVNNGGCHPLAKCSHDDRSAVYVNCTCPVDLGYSGNGFSCHGNILMEIEKHPKLTLTAEVLKRMKNAGKELLLNNNYTTFVVSDDGLRNFSLAYHQVVHWLKPENIIQLMNYHTILGSYTLDKLVAESGIKKIQTMADGFSIYVTQGDDGIVRLLPQRTGTVATVMESDIIATNGYINVIDKVLQPYEPMLPEDYPDLETFFSNHSEYSIFAGWLKDKNLTYKLENSLDSYTLFVPNNEVAKTVNRTITTDYLRYYIIPKLEMMASTDGGDTEITDLGIDHQLIIMIKDWNKYTVNDVPILKADMFTYGGLVNEIGGLLHPVLHKCDEKNSTVDFGPCTVCQPGSSVYPCIGNSQPVPEDGPFECMYTENSIFGRVIKKKGCQGLCVYYTTFKGCCSGYYGEDCEECPSGPEFPCGGHGSCSDGLRGDGSCQCDPKFKGDQCNSCVEGWAGINCDIDKTSCSYNNGGCHRHADCSQDGNSKVSCSCWNGFHGDGFNCSGPCNIDNGGCHSNATCKYINKDNLRCECNEGLVGDGRSSCMGDILSSLALVPQTSLFLKSLQSVSNKTLLSNLKSSTSAELFIVFVPIDKSLKMRTLPEASVIQQIVVVKETSQLTLLSPIDFSNITMTTLSNQSVTLSFNMTDQSFLVNGTRVLSGNIQFTNGIVHVVEKPFTAPPLLESEQSRGTSVGAIVGPIVALVVIAIVVVVGVLVYRRTQVGYWRILQSWIAKRKDSEVANQETPLHVDDDDGGASISGLPQRDADFGNPLYQADDLE